MSVIEHGHMNEHHTMVLSAAVMFGAGTLIDLVESLVPGGQAFSLAPGLGSLVLVTLLATLGSRLPRMVVGALGPVGVALIAVALATTNTPGDGAVLYMWPVLWQAYFFGRRGTLLIIASVGVSHGVALLLMAHGDLDRWIDVMSAVSVVGAVVELLSARNRRLLEHISAEARVDEPTQLLNRRGFDEACTRELGRAARDQSSLGVVLFDLDHFKRINDEFGHEMGDRVRSALRGSAADADLPPVTISAGAAAVVAPVSIQALLKSADTALYAAKSRGRDRTVVARPAAGGSSDLGLEIGEHRQDATVVAR